MAARDFRHSRRERAGPGHVLGRGERSEQLPHDQLRETPTELARGSQLAGPDVARAALQKQHREVGAERRAQRPAHHAGIVGAYLPGLGEGHGMTGVGPEQRDRTSPRVGEREDVHRLVARARGGGRAQRGATWQVARREPPSHAPPIDRVRSGAAAVLHQAPGHRLGRREPAQQRRAPLGHPVYIRRLRAAEQWFRRVHRGCEVRVRCREQKRRVAEREMIAHRGGDTALQVFGDEQQVRGEDRDAGVRCPEQQRVQLQRIGHPAARAGAIGEPRERYRLPGSDVGGSGRDGGFRRPGHH